jgi:hypothetical protein
MKFSRECTGAKSSDSGSCVAFGLSGGTNAQAALRRRVSAFAPTHA